jgi:hypothetical protein
MAQKEGLIHNQSFRVAIGVAVGLAVMALSADSVTDVVPIAVLAVGVVSYRFLEDLYCLPTGTERIFYGAASVSLAGGGLVVTAYSAVWVGVGLGIVGAWFVFDGATAVLYGQESTEHEYVSETGEDSEEVMSRMRSLRKVYVAVKDAPEPRTFEEIAENHRFDEQRTESALEYLDSRGRVSEEGGRYRAEPQRWGKVTPVVEFFTWLPKRVFRPFYLIATGGRSWG